jgi:hypothetical protein
MNERWLMFLALTAANILFDWTAGRLGERTVSFECGIISTMIAIWLCEREG